MENHQFIPPEGIVFCGCQRSRLTVFSQVPLQAHCQQDPWVVCCLLLSLPEICTFSFHYQQSEGCLTLILILQRDQNHKLKLTLESEWLYPFYQILEQSGCVLWPNPFYNNENSPAQDSFFPLFLSTPMNRHWHHTRTLGEEIQGGQQPVVISSRISHLNKRGTAPTQQDRRLTCPAVQVLQPLLSRTACPKMC